MSMHGLKPASLLALMVALATYFIAGDASWLDTSTIIAIYALIALSVGVSFGMAGILSVAQAAFAALGAYTTAILTARYGVHPYWGLIAAVAVPAAFAYPFSRLLTRMSPLALALATLIFGHILDHALRDGGGFTGGYIGISGIPPLPFVSDPLQTHLFAWGLVVVVALLYGNLHGSSYGASMRTIKVDTLRAQADGINVPHMRSVAMTIAAGLAGLGGWLYAHYIAYLAPDSLDPNLSISVLLMAIAGGTATVLGPVIGAVVLTVVSTLIPGGEATGMFYGGVLLAVLLLAPKGLLPLLSSAIKRQTRLVKPSAKGADAGLRSVLEAETGRKERVK